MKVFFALLIVGKTTFIPQIHGICIQLANVYKV